MPSLPGLGGYRERLQRITRDSNETLMQVVDDLVAVCRDGAEQTFLPDELAARCEAYVDSCSRSGTLTSSRTRTSSLPRSGPPHERLGRSFEPSTVPILQGPGNGALSVRSTGDGGTT